MTKRSDPPTDRRAAQAFPSTRWSRILGTGSQSGTLPDVESLAKAYWRPVYGYVRSRFSKTDDEAVDCTQDFFLWMIERGFLGRADPERGRFRGFLKVSLRNFMNDRERKAKAQRRGGDRLHLRLHFGDEDLPVLELDAKSQTPDEVLDDLWRSTLVERATQTLEQELAALGKETYFAVFRDYFLSSEEGVDYQAVADRHEISTVQVSNHLAHAKKRYRRLLRAAVMETVSNPEELEVELRWLFGERWS